MPTNPGNPRLSIVFLLHMLHLFNLSTENGRNKAVKKGNEGTYFRANVKFIYQNYKNKKFFSEGKIETYLQNKKVKSLLTI